MAEITFVASDGKKLTSTLDVMKLCKPVEVYFAENKTDTEMPLPRVGSDALGKIIKFCEHYQNNPLPAIEKPIKSSKLEEVIKDEWLCKFLDMPAKEINELLIASDYMSLKQMEELLSCVIATRIFGKSTEDIRAEFGIANDFTPEEEKQVQEFFDWADNIQTQ
eukprot:TRINITY_DN135279_c1_g1_i1.p14 TRINITY_DN135279_c1_g1~~TRINITY_DN135279_c1_g1_i1.p14  ORF type:complete len:164 (-),score=32.99 TRINITY_DN135279_c1_g1_i1:75-566(-)